MILDTNQRYVQSWSGGKDSTCSIVLENLHRDELGIPPSPVIMAEVMFDNERGISGEYPDHIEWVYTKAKPLLESWGHKVTIMKSKKDYVSLFRHVVTHSKHPERNGKKTGFPLGGACAINGRCKMETFKQINRETSDSVHIIGIAADETKRLGGMTGRKVSLLQRYGIFEEDTYRIIKPYGLLSPAYTRWKRGGCWFCMNQSYAAFAWLKRHYPEYWGYLRELAEESGTISKYFKYNESFFEVDFKVDNYLRAPSQISIFEGEGND